MSQWYLRANLVKIHILVQEIKSVDKAYFYSLYSVVTLKLGKGQVNKIFLNLLTISMLQYIKFGQNPSFVSRDRVQTSFFGQI